MVLASLVCLDTLLIPMGCACLLTNSIMDVRSDNLPAPNAQLDMTLEMVYAGQESVQLIRVIETAKFVFTTTIWSLQNDSAFYILVLVQVAI